MQEILDFLTALTENNNREWFGENKEWYLRCKKQFESFTADYIEGVATIDKSVGCLEPKDCIWRIYRDIRFSTDKRPYKDWFGAFIAPHGGKKSPYGGYYVHIQPGHCMFAGGIWNPEPHLLKALRQSVYDNYDEVEAIMADPHFSRYFRDFDTDYMLKKVPAGFPADFEHADWLKRKAYTFSCAFTDKEAASPKFLQKVLDIVGAAKPMNDFLNYTFEELKS